MTWILLILITAAALGLVFRSFIKIINEENEKK
jgi:hypothetical protein